MLALFAGLFLYGYIVAPALAVYSWLRWSRSKRRRSRKTRVSLAALAIASAALLVGVVCVAISSNHHGVFLYLAPRFHPVYLFGIVTSGLAVLVALIGAMQSNPIRLKALIVSLGTAAFWFLAGSAQ